MPTWFTNFNTNVLVPVGLAIIVITIVITGIRMAVGGARGFAEGVVALAAILAGVFLVVGHDAVLNAMKAAVGGT
jgi:hypothetical protein